MKEDAVSFSVPGEPKGKGRPRFDPRGFAYKPTATRNAENETRFEYVRQCGDFKFADDAALCSSVTVPAIARDAKDEYTDFTAYVRSEIHTEPEYEVFRLLVKGGLSEEAAAGVLGNVDVETGGTFNPAAKSRTGYYGLAQWNPGSRRKSILPGTATREHAPGHPPRDAAQNSR